nr:protein enabled homolog [Aegilops tauschii subsp. strangulata]
MSPLEHARTRASPAPQISLAARQPRFSDDVVRTAPCLLLARTPSLPDRAPRCIGRVLRSPVRGRSHLAVPNPLPPPHGGLAAPAPWHCLAAPLPPPVSGCRYFLGRPYLCKPRAAPASPRCCGCPHRASEPDAACAQCTPAPSVVPLRPTASSPPRSAVAAATSVDGLSPARPSYGSGARSAQSGAPLLAAPVCPYPTPVKAPGAYDKGGPPQNGY